MVAEPEIIHEAPKERRLFLKSLAIPFYLVVAMWLFKAVELILDVRFTGLGIYPLTAQGLPGIALSPFIHGDFSHLAGNSMSVLVLGGLLFYFYKDLAWKVLILGWVVTGFWVWVAARDAFHIGASGVVYCLAAFLFTSGLLRRNPQLIAITLLVVFLYGGLAWGIFPAVERISWESHLFGLASGTLLAIFYKKSGPARKVYSWELENTEEEEGFESVLRKEFPDEDHSRPP